MKRRKIIKKLAAAALIKVFLTGVAVSVLAVYSAHSDSKPSASLKIKPESGSVDTSFTFDASESINSFGDKSGLEYRFNFDVGEIDFTPWANQPIRTYKYEKSGTKSVILEVREKGGSMDRITQDLTVNERPRFNGYIEVSTAQGKVGQELEFRVSIATISSFLQEDFDVRMDFDGNGAYDTDFSKNRIFHYIYSEPGFYLPRMLIKSPSGEEKVIIGYRTGSETPGEILITGANWPRASMKVSPARGKVDTAFSIDAGGSFDYEDQSSLLYRVDYESDGIYDTDFTNQKIFSHIYETPGVKKITLEVKDSDGNIDRTSQSLFVVERDFPPTAEILVNVPKLRRDHQALIGLEIGFRVQARDTDSRNGNTLLYRFDFESDGTYDTPYSRRNNATHIYTEAGVKKISAQIQDGAGNTVIVEKTLELVTNTPPVAVLSSDRENGTTSNRFRFDARSSSDDQFLPSTLEYRFDFNSDGVYDTAFSKRSSIEHFFKNSGLKKVTVQVKDPLGMTATATKQVEILTNSQPQAFFTVTPKNGTFNTRFNFDATSSFDGQTDFKRLSFRWDFDYHGNDDIVNDTQFTASSKLARRFHEPGRRMIKLDVRDENGVVTSYFNEVNIHWASPFMEFLNRNGVMRGYKGGDMRPDQQVTRAEFVTMLTRAKRTRIAAGTIPKVSPYYDVSKRDWFYRNVLAATQAGYIQGFSDGTFRPHQSISRAEIVVIAMRAFEMREGHTREFQGYRDVSVDVWYYEAIQKASIAGVIQGYGDGSFRPNQPVTRGEASKILAEAIKKLR